MPLPIRDNADSGHVTRHELSPAPHAATAASTVVMTALQPTSVGMAAVKTASAAAIGATLAVRTFLAADIGGTHARLGLISSKGGQTAPEVLAYRSYRCADHPRLDDIVRCFGGEFEVQTRELVLACAGYLHAGVVVNRNLAWPVVPAQLAKALDFDRVSFLNDFEALAHAAAYLDGNHTAVLKAAAASQEPQPVVIIGPGTGLGVAVRFPGHPPRVMATEAGQIQLSARIGREQQVLARLASTDGYTSYETVLSGPGLRRLYIALCAIHDRYPVFDEPAAITAAALANSDECACEALSLFCGWLGSFAGDLVMLYGASGGVYLAGGFLSQIADFMPGSPLVERFLDKGVMRPFLQRTPIHVIDHGQLGVIGAARWYLEAHSGKDAGEAHIDIGDACPSIHQ